MKATQYTTARYITEERNFLLRNKLKVGSRVRVTRTAETDQDGWRNSWVDQMEKAIGRICIIKHLSDDGNGIQLISAHTPNAKYNHYQYPWFVLEPVAKRVRPKKEVDPNIRFFVCRTNSPTAQREFWKVLSRGFKRREEAEDFAEWERKKKINKRREVFIVEKRVD